MRCILPFSQAYGSGRMMTSEIKQLLVDVLQPLVADFQRARAAVTDDVVNAFMTVRKLSF